MTITASYDTLVEQGPSTAARYMRAAIREIDESFGNGYAAKNPELVAAFIKTAGQDFTTACSIIAVQEATDKVAYALENIGRSLAE